MRLAQAPVDGRHARQLRNEAAKEPATSRCLKPSKLHEELAAAVDDHDNYREQAAAYGNLLRPDLAGYYNALADMAASRAQTLCDQITAAGHATPLVLSHYGPKNTNRRIL